MALAVPKTQCLLIVFIILFCVVINQSCCFKPKHLNVSVIKLQSHSGWASAISTWYGSADGDGNDGGACGYGTAVGQAPFSSRIAAGGPSLFQSGEGCGACYAVKCTRNTACSGNPVRVVITDESPESPYTAESVHFDLSGIAFGDMAISGQANQLRNSSVLQIQYKRVPCNYPGYSVSFQVDAGSNSYHFAILIKYMEGDGTLAAVHLKEDVVAGAWQSMQRSLGALWKLDRGAILQAPFSIKLVSESGQTVVANNAIPVGYQPGMSYQSVNFLN